jgi:hypothetical protein
MLLFQVKQFELTPFRRQLELSNKRLPWPGGQREDQFELTTSPTALGRCPRPSNVPLEHRLATR